MTTPQNKVNQAFAKEQQMLGAIQGDNDRNTVTREFVTTKIFRELKFRLLSCSKREIMDDLKQRVLGHLNWSGKAVESYEGRVAWGKLKPVMEHSLRTRKNSVIAEIRNKMTCECLCTEMHILCSSIPGILLTCFPCCLL